MRSEPSWRGPATETPASLLEAAVAVGIDVDRIRGILTAIAPIVGAPRVATALIAIGEALELELEDFEASL